MKSFCILILMLPLILSFDFTAEIKQWELSVQPVNAKILNKRSKALIQNEICSSEVSRQLFPLNCLRLVKVTQHLVQTQNYLEKMHYINKLCYEKVNTVMNKKGLSSLNPQSKHLNKCREAIAERIKIINYKDEHIY